MSFISKNLGRYKHILRCSLIDGARVYKNSVGYCFTDNARSIHSSSSNGVNKNGLFKTSTVLRSDGKKPISDFSETYTRHNYYTIYLCKRYLTRGVPVRSFPYKTLNNNCSHERGVALRMFNVDKRSSSSLPCNGPVKSQEEAWSKSCGCCGNQSKGDKELAEFLTEELRIVKNSDAGPQTQTLPRLQGFTVTRAEGPLVVLTRQIENETPLLDVGNNGNFEVEDNLTLHYIDVTLKSICPNCLYGIWSFFCNTVRYLNSITVKFSVNDSLEEDLTLEAEEPTNAVHNHHVQHGPMSSRPVFVVEINKGGPLSLCLSCSFISSNDMPSEEEMMEHGDDFCEYMPPWNMRKSLIEIQHVTLLPSNVKWTEDVFTLSGSDARINSLRVTGSADSGIESTLYDMLLVMLAERGIDREFAQHLVEFSTSFEHLTYLTFLEKLRDFVTCKIK